LTENLLEDLENEVGNCINCGFCETVCPTLDPSGFSLWKGARGRVIMGRTLLEDKKKGIPVPVLSDSFYSCLDCHACLFVCPAGVNAGKVSQLSREIITTSSDRKNENPYARMIVEVTAKYGNPLGVKSRSAAWSEGLQFDRNAEYLLYTGNMFQLMPYTKNLNSARKTMGNALSNFMASRVANHPSMIKMLSRMRDKEMEQKNFGTLRNIVKLLRLSGISFSYLGENEPYPGTFIYDLGYIDKFKKYAKYVYSVLKESGANKIITVDPHTYDLLKNTFPKFVDNFDLDIFYYLDLIKMPAVQRGDEKIVYHEPCHFVLRDPKYSKPFQILSSTANTVLARRSGSKSRCCGGPDELTFPELSEKASQIRYQELKNTGADIIVTACPICNVNLSKENRTMEIADYLASKLPA
jgi:glycolate oxidase iron-sulfur subunit